MERRQEKASVPDDEELRGEAVGGVGVAKVSEGVGGVGVAKVAEVGCDERTQGAASDLSMQCFHRRPQPLCCQIYVICQLPLAVKRGQKGDCRALVNAMTSAVAFNDPPHCQEQSVFVILKQTLSRCPQEGTIEAADFENRTL